MLNRIPFGNFQSPLLYLNAASHSVLPPVFLKCTAMIGRWSTPSFESCQVAAAAAMMSGCTTDDDGTIGVVDAPIQGPAECTWLHCGAMPAEASYQQPQPSVFGSHHCHTEHVPSACRSQHRFAQASADMSASLACVSPSH